MLFGDLASTLGEGGVLEGLVNIPKVNLLVCMIPNSISEPELISAETLFNNLANVTFFSNFGSLRADCTVASLNFVSPTFDLVSFSTVLSVLRSLSWINSPKLTFRVLITGETNC